MYGTNLAVGIYQVTVKQTVIPSVSTNFTFLLNVQSSYIQDLSSLIVSGPTNITIYLNQKGVNLTLQNITNLVDKGLPDCAK